MITPETTTTILLYLFSIIIGEVYFWAFAFLGRKEWNHGSFYAKGMLKVFCIWGGFVTIAIINLIIA
jgi:hypothetical protein